MFSKLTIGFDFRQRHSRLAAHKGQREKATSHRRQINQLAKMSRRRNR